MGSNRSTLLNSLLAEKFSVESLLAPSAQSLRTKAPGASLKVVHLSWMDAAGAGTSAYRLHRGLLKLGVDSTMLVLQKTRNDATVKVPPVSYSGEIVEAYQQSRETAMAIVKSDHRWGMLASQYPNRPRGAELFTDPFSDVRLHFISEIIDADIVNFHWVGAILNYPSLPRSLAEKPIVWTLHDMNPFTGGCHYADNCERYAQQCGMCPNLGSSMREDASWHFHKIKQSAFKNAVMHIVTPSVWLGDCSQKSSLFGTYKHDVVPYGLCTEVYKPGGGDAIRAEYGIAGDKKLVLFGAAAIENERKGLKYLIEALVKLGKTQRCENVMLGVFGNRDPDLNLDVPFPIARFGIISDENRLAKIYSAADVFVLPTLADNLPNTILEAMACGCPTVGFETGGVPDMIEHKKNGYLVKQKNVDGLAAGIQWAISASEAGESVRKYCREKALKLYDETVQGRAYIDIYNSMLSAKREAEALTDKGEEEANKGNAEEAMSCFKKAGSMYPMLSRPYNDQGMLSFEQKRVAQALGYFTDAISINPNNRNAMLNLGDVLFAIGKAEEFIPVASAFLDDRLYDNEMRAMLTNAQAVKLDTMLLEAGVFNDGYRKKAYEVCAVIVAVHSDISFIRELISDVLAQDFKPPLEILCVDATGGKADFSQLMQEMKAHGCIRCISSGNSLHIYQAVNLGVRATEAPYCLAAVTGDRLSTNCCKSLHAALQSNAASACAYGNTFLTDNAHESFSAHTPSTLHGGEFVWRQLAYDDLIEEYGIGPHPLWRRSLHETLGFFDFRYETGADQDFWLRVAREQSVTYVPEYTGLLWLGEHIKSRLTRTMKQFAHVRARHKLFPMKQQAMGHDMHLHPVETEKNAGEILDSISALVEQGRNKEALAVHDENLAVLKLSYQYDSIARLIGRLREKVEKES